MRIQNSFIDMYDGRGLVVRRTVPGADNTHLAYDGNDRLCRTQDGRQRADGSWTEYDMSGFVSGVTWGRGSDEMDGMGERTVTL